MALGTSISSVVAVWVTWPFRTASVLILYAPDPTSGPKIQAESSDVLPMAISAPVEEMQGCPVLTSTHRQTKVGVDAGTNSSTQLALMVTFEVVLRVCILPPDIDNRFGQVMITSADTSENSAGSPSGIETFSLKT